MAAPSSLPRNRGGSVGARRQPDTSIRCQRVSRPRFRDRFAFMGGDFELAGWGQLLPGDPEAGVAVPVRVIDLQLTSATGDLDFSIGDRCLPGSVA